MKISFCKISSRYDCNGAENSHIKRYSLINWLNIYRCGSISNTDIFTLIIIRPAKSFLEMCAMEIMKTPNGFSMHPKLFLNANVLIQH